MEPAKVDFATSIQPIAEVAFGGRGEDEWYSNPFGNLVSNLVGWLETIDGHMLC